MLRYFTGFGSENLDLLVVLKSTQNFMAIHSRVIEIFFNLILSQTITKVIRLHPLETTNVCTKMCANLSDRC